MTETTPDTTPPIPTEHDEADATIVGRFTNSQVVEEFLTGYGAEIIANQFPSPIDGLKKVHLRMMWITMNGGKLYDGGKSGEIVGSLGGIHPHGDVSNYTAITRLAQSWNVNPPLVNIDGKAGTYSGEPPGALRYTSMHLSSFAKDLYFNHVDKNALPKHMGVDGEFEPKFMVPAIPAALLFDSLSIGYGYHSDTLGLNLENLCDLTSLFIKHLTTNPHKPFDVSKHAELFLPDFPTYEILTNKDELISEYKKRNFTAKIRLDGLVTITENTIVIRSLPHHINFKPLRPDIENAIIGRKDKDPIIADRGRKLDAAIAMTIPQSEDKNIGELLIELKRGANPFDTWDLLQKVISISGAITPFMNFSLPNGRMANLSPEVIMRMWYKERYATIMASKRTVLQSRERALWLVKAQITILDRIDEALAIIRGGYTEDEACVKLTEAFGLTPFQSRGIMSLAVRVLTTTGESELRTREAKLSKEIQTIIDSFDKIPQEISDYAQKLKSDYGSRERRTHIPNYIGYVKTMGGSILFENHDDLLEIAANFPKADFTVYVFDGPTIWHVSENKKLVKGVFHKYSRGDYFGTKTNDLHLYTVSLNDDGTACSVKGTVLGTRADPYFYVPKRSVAVSRTGQIHHIDVKTDISFRKTICRGSFTDYIYLWPDVTETSYMAVFNSEEPNVVQIIRIKPDAKKVLFSPVGKQNIQWSRFGKFWYINLPSEYLNRNASRVLCIHDAETLIPDVGFIKLDLNTNKVKRSSALTLL